MSDVGVERGPVWVGLGLSSVAVGAAAVGLALSGVATGAALSAAGGMLLLVATVQQSRSLIDLGALVMFVGVVFSGAGGGFAGPLLIAMIGTVVAWDAAEHSLSVGEQLGTEAPSKRVVVVHVAETTVLGVGGGAIGFGVYQVAGGGQPVAALLLLVTGSMLIVWSFRR